MKYRNTTRYTCIKKKLRIRKMDKTQFLSQSEATDKNIALIAYISLYCYTAQLALERTKARFFKT